MDAHAYATPQYMLSTQAHHLVLITCAASCLHAEYALVNTPAELHMQRSTRRKNRIAAGAKQCLCLHLSVVCMFKRIHPSHSRLLVCSALMAPSRLYLYIAGSFAHPVSRSAQCPPWRLRFVLGLTAMRTKQLKPATGEVWSMRAPENKAHLHCGIQ